MADLAMAKKSYQWASFKFELALQQNMTKTALFSNLEFTGTALHIDRRVVCYGGADVRALCHAYTVG
jgi:hypothetical protein